MRSTGEIVRYWFDAGGRSTTQGMGPQIIYGIVTAAGAKTYSVTWESGNRNRLRQGDRRVALVVDADELVEARQALGLVQRRR